MTIKQLIESGAPIIDVRTPAEFQSGHVPGSKNIPLNEIPDRLDELEQLEQPFILCCLSGGRSGQAWAYLKNQGMDCVNGGPWTEVNFHFSAVNAS